MADLTILDLSGPQPLFTGAGARNALTSTMFLKPPNYRRRTLPPTRTLAAASASTPSLVLSPPNEASTSTSRTLAAPDFNRKVKRRRRSSLGDIELPSSAKGKSKGVDRESETLPIQEYNHNHNHHEHELSEDPDLVPPPRPTSAPPVPARFRPGYLPDSISRAPIRELERPAPPLLRPAPFWRHTTRSGVTSPVYSPSSHLIRRSTFIAAGLSFDRPYHDLSAFCVESRIGFVVLQPDQNF